MTSIEFRMPDVGEGIAQAEIVSWLVAEGELVSEDQAVVSVETDKSIVEIPAPVAGTIASLRGAEGDVVPVGDVLLVIEPAASLTGAASDSGAAPDTDDGVARPEPDAPGTASPDPVPTSTGASEDHGSAPPRGQRPRPLASPRTRRLAAQRGIDLAQITGTGPHGRILEADLERLPDGAPTPGQAAAATPAATSAASPATAAMVTSTAHPAPGIRASGSRHARSERADEVVHLRGLRRSIARSMTEALTIPHVTEFREIDATNLLAAHRTLRAALGEQGVRLSLFPLLLQSVVRALELQPSMNATFDADAETVTRHAGVHLGMATATEDGLIVPVIRDADTRGLTDLALEVDRLAEAARTRTATSSELTGGTFTVTNFGSFGTWLGNPIIRPPEVGIAGFGRITEQVIAQDGQPVVRPVLPIVVATDHRLHDGSHLADFVGAVSAALTDPILLLA